MNARFPAIKIDCMNLAYAFTRLHFAGEVAEEAYREKMSKKEGMGKFTEETHFFLFCDELLVTVLL